MGTLPATAGLPASCAEFAEICDLTARASRLARRAHIAAVQDQPMMRILAEIRAARTSSACPPRRARSCRARARCGWRLERCACRRRWWLRRMRCSARRSRSCARRPGSCSSASRRARHLDRRAASSSAWQVAMMFLALLLYSPIDLMYGVIPATPSASMAAGVSAVRNRLAVALFTLLSVACAERITATNSSNGVRYLSSVRGAGIALLQPREDGAPLCGVHGCPFTARPVRGARARPPSWRRSRGGALPRAAAIARYGNRSARD